MGADRYAELALLARYVVCQLSYIRFTMVAAVSCQLLTAYATIAFAASDKASCGIIESKARYDMAIHGVCPSTQRQDQLLLNNS